ncbi:F-box protein [Melia azedarach]|uniref:F-box protein n=1 Tax=Melia azedarach TaxID=155640 RepID=A0ACC1XR57_MELAZ|nr:F-box protein [Melia azedarach]
MEREIILTSDGALPDDLVVETLLRLPVKSLLRFRSVCRSWYGLVKNSNFIYKHLKKDDNIRAMIRCTYYDDTDEYDELKSYFSLVPDKTLRDLSFENLDPKIPGIRIGPYDGIFCLFNNPRRITLWNVTTNEFRVLPKCRAHLPCYTTVHYSNFGFGLDPIADDYKLVIILTLWHEKRREFYDFSHVTVYTFSTNSWRDLKGFEMRHDYMYDRIDNVYLNGFCYWLVLRTDYHKAILSFDMNGEMFEEIQGPNIPEREDIFESSLIPWTLGIYEDSLGLLYSDKYAHSFDLWMMKGGSWIKYLTFGPFIETYQPIGYWRKGEFFLQSNNKRLILYNSEIKEMRDLGITGLWFSVHILKESLIPIKGEDVLVDLFDIPWNILGITDSILS